MKKAPVSTQTFYYDPYPTTWEFKWELSYNRDNASKTIGYQIPRPVPGMGDFFWSCWSLGSQRSHPCTKQYRGLSLLLVTLQNLTVRLHCLKHHILEAQNMEKLDTDLEALS